MLGANVKSQMILSSFLVIIATNADVKLHLISLETKKSLGFYKVEFNEIATTWNCNDGANGNYNTVVE